MAEVTAHTLTIERPPVKEGLLHIVFRTSPYSPGSDLLQNDPHPFSKIETDLCAEDMLAGEYGVIVADNLVTRALIELIGETADVISQASGHTDWRCYRAMLISALCTLWD